MAAVFKDLSQIRFSSPDYRKPEVEVLKNIILTFTNHPVCWEKVQRLLQQGDFSVKFIKKGKSTIASQWDSMSRVITIVIENEIAPNDIASKNMGLIIDPFIYALCYATHPYFIELSNKCERIENAGKYFYKTFTNCFPNFLKDPKAFAIEMEHAKNTVNNETALILNSRLGEDLDWILPEGAPTRHIVRWDETQIALLQEPREYKGLSILDISMLILYRLILECHTRDIAQAQIDWEEIKGMYEKLQSLVLEIDCEEIKGMHEKLQSLVLDHEQIKQYFNQNFEGLRSERREILFGREVGYFQGLAHRYLSVADYASLSVQQTNNESLQRLSTLLPPKPKEKSSADKIPIYLKPRTAPFHWIYVASAFASASKEKRFDDGSIEVYAKKLEQPTSKQESQERMEHSRHRRLSKKRLNAGGSTPSNIVPSSSILLFSETLVWGATAAIAGALIFGTGVVNISKPRPSS